MKPGERIPLIKASVDALLDRFDDARLVLDQFQLDTSGSYHDSERGRREYLTDVVKYADDETLSSLHDYLVGEEQAPNAATRDDEPWGDQPVRVFLSHKWEDAEWVGSLRDVMARFGMTAFVAHRDITPSRQWREVIKSGLRSCDMFVAVLHPEFHASQWCDQEVGWALGRAIPIATVRRNTEVERGHDGFLEEVQDIVLDPARGSGEWRVAEELFRAAIRSLKPPELVRRMIAEALVTSPNFDNTRRLWGVISRQEHWERESLDRLKYAVQTNRQVYDANVEGTLVPELVDALVEQFDPTSPYDAENPF